MKRLVLTLATLWVAVPAWASHDPSRTVTIVVGGFEQDGVAAGGVFGDVRVEALLDEIASLVDLPTTNDPANLNLPNVVTSTQYYGDTAPSYYDVQDHAELAQTTALWGGGVPRYALIVAKFARYMRERSGASQVNFVSASFGSLIVRWLIEKDLEGLAGQGKVARWVSAEGLVAGSWPASQPNLIDLWELVQVPSIDVDHMTYGWVEANLRSPRTDADDPKYGHILMAQMGSTEDHLNQRALTAAMLAADEFQANDGVQGFEDTYFHTLGASAKLEGLPPLRSSYHDDHYSLETDRGAWAQVALFLTQSRRVTITMTRAQVSDIHEGVLFRPAEIVFDSAIYAPSVAGWGISEPLSRQALDGASVPIRLFSSNGQNKFFSQVLFDGMVSPEETELELQLGATEIDLELRYGVVETVTQPFLTDLGGGTLSVPVGQPGTYTFQAGSWNCDLTVALHQYAFSVPTDVMTSEGSAPPLRMALRIVPNPSRSAVRILTEGTGGRENAGPAILRIVDAAGRLVGRLESQAGQPLVWDHRDAAGHLLPPGVYFYDLEMSGQRVQAKGTLLR